VILAIIVLKGRVCHYLKDQTKFGFGFADSTNTRGGGREECVLEIM